MGRSEDKEQFIRSLFGAYRTKQRHIVEDILGEGFTFTSPYDDAIDKAAYFERCWPNSERIREHVLEKILVEGDEAFVRDKCITTDGREFRNTEFFRFDGDKLVEVQVYFGASYRDGKFIREG